MEKVNLGDLKNKEKRFQNIIFLHLPDTFERVGKKEPGWKGGGNAMKRVLGG